MAADSPDWQTLDRLRTRFLAGGVGEVYWTSRADLGQYDRTYAQRIGWKWDAVLRELALRVWRPPAGPMLDWGCGSGIAGRRVLEAFGAGHFGTIMLADRSPLATAFAAERAQAVFPGLDVVVAGGAAPFATLVVSHVLNELDAEGQSTLRSLLARARAVLWVEPGTHADSLALIAWREELLAGGFNAVAPCTHRARCGMLNPHNATHWCHHFAEPPAGVLGDVDWQGFARRAGIDLRATPYSFLVLERRDRLRGSAPDWTRAIGHPRVYKGYAKILACSREDVAEVAVQERDNRELFRGMKKGRCPTLLRISEGAKEWKRVEETL